MNESGRTLFAEHRQKKCPSCGMTLKDFQKTTMLGCPECYVLFEKEINAIIEDVHDGDRHVGKIPANKKLSIEILSLQTELSKAVKAQNFEKAAELRDKIKSLRNRTICCGIQNEKNDKRTSG